MHQKKKCKKVVHDLTFNLKTRDISSIMKLDFKDEDNEKSVSSSDSEEGSPRDGSSRSKQESILESDKEKKLHDFDPFATPRSKHQKSENGKNLQYKNNTSIKASTPLDLCTNLKRMTSKIVDKNDLINYH